MARTRFLRQSPKDGAEDELRSSNMPVPVRSIEQEAEEEFTLARARATKFLQTADASVLDRSASFTNRADDKTGLTKSDAEIGAQAAFLSNHPAGSLLTVIAFSSDATVVLPLCDVNSRKMEIISALYRMPPPSGGTFLAKALPLAGEQLQRAPSGMKRRCFVLTDGLPSDYPLPAAQALKADDVELVVLGFGVRSTRTIDEDLLREIASIGPGGRPLYYHFTEARGLTAFMAQSSRILE